MAKKSKVEWVMKYIALLRGINVNGRNMIKMVDLKKTFESLGFKNVTTYVQSGNVVFDHEFTDTIRLRDEIEEKIIQAYGLSIQTIIRTGDELSGIINNNPYIREQNIELDKLHVTLLSDIPEPSVVSSININKEENEKFIIISREVYLYCPNGYGKTKLNNAIFEKKLKTSATTRNWKTMNMLFEMSKK